MIGFDCGTYNLVVCKRGKDNKFEYKKEVNAFLEIPLDNRFVFNMMKNAGVPLIERDNVAYALGQRAVDIAYTMPSLDLKRPMIHGCVNPKEAHSFQIMSIMIHSLLDELNQDKETLYYSVPANAINEETDADYHGKVIDAIFKAFQDEHGYSVKANPINEGLALVYSELGAKAYTGLGISCLVSGTKIYTSEGILPIEEVTEGLEVITHKGRWRKINKVVTKKFSGVKTKIQIQGYSNSTDDYQFVDNHELYVYRNNSWQWIGCEELSVGDIVGEPIVKQDRDSTIPSINLCERITSSKIWDKKRIDLTPDLQRLIGYFLGDGSINSSEGCIQFDFGINEKQYVQDVKDILFKNINKQASETLKEENVIRVKCYSKGLVSWFSNHFYDKNKNKKYPWDISRLNHSHCLNLLTGLIRSDGCFDKNGCTFYNTSTNLIILTKQLFSKIGIASSISNREPRSHYFEKENRMICGKKQEWSVSCHGKKCSTSILDYMINVNCETSQITEKIFINGDFCCGRVQKIEHEDYEGTVYDLQVEEDHSFSGPFLTIHNCGAGMVNICFSMYGAPVFSFAIVNSGDWIDKMAAKATGESITFINKEKTKINLTEEPKNMVERAIQTQYKLMIEKTVVCIKQGLTNEHKKARPDGAIDIVIAGGSSSPVGFDVLFEQIVREAKLPISIDKIVKPIDPLFSVSKGCLIAAENAM
jgi:intein/homing endonuclease